MSVTIQVQQVRTVEEGPLYRVDTSVVYNKGIDRNVFVFNTETEEFEHVATPWDMENTPGTRQEAILGDINYYRLSAVVKDFELVTVASEFAAYTLGRLSALAREYEIVGETFEGSGTYTYTGD